MNRAKWLILIILISFCGGAWAQNISSVMVQTVPNGAAFMVDGVSYITAQTFLWPQGSKHTVTFPFSLDVNGNSLPFQQSSDGEERFAFGGWSTNLGPLAGGTSTASVTADPGVTSVTASLTETYLVTVNVPTGNACASNANFTYGSGIVLFNGSCLPATTSFYMGLASIPLTAVPYPGWVFYGWQINGSMVVQSISSFQLKGAATITPLFSIAKRVHFMTNPPGLMVLVDRTQSATPLLPSQNGATCTPAYTQQGPVPPAGFPALCAGDFDFLPNSTHSIGANTPQQDQVGNYWVFEGYTNGTGQNGTYTADIATNTATTLTATFVPGVKVTLITSQPGLALTVDGRSNWQGYTFVWGQGETHTISAPASQVDAQGRTWTFVSWSNGGAATQTLDGPLDHHFPAYDRDFPASAAGDYQQRAAGHAVFSGRIALHNSLRGEPRLRLRNAGDRARIDFVQRGFANGFRRMVRWNLGRDAHDQFQWVHADVFGELSFILGIGDHGESGGISEFHVQSAIA